jgi:hypothetical protein
MTKTVAALLSISNRYLDNRIAGKNIAFVGTRLEILI